MNLNEDLLNEALKVIHETQSWDAHRKATAYVQPALSWAAKHHPTKHRGSVYDLKDDFDGALADYVTAIRLDPNVASAYYRRSLVYFELGDSVRALADCDIAKLPRILTTSVGSTQIRVLSILVISPFRSPAERREFVEDLCSNEGMPSLIKEIERVIFEAHPAPKRDGAADFDELLDMRACNHRDTRDLEAAALTGISDQIGQEMEKNATGGRAPDTSRGKLKLIGQ